MRFYCLPFVVAMLIPVIAGADDSFVYTRRPAPVAEQQETAPRQEMQPQGVISNGGNVHEVPATPPGWDSLTTGTANGGGVLGNGNGMNGGYGSPLGTLSGNNIITNGNAANDLLNSMASGGARQSFGDVSVSSDGDVSPQERAMYAAFLGSLLQTVRAQPDTAPGTATSYNGGGWKPVTPAFNTGVPAHSGSMGVSAPAVPCPNGARGVAGVGC